MSDDFGEIFVKAREARGLTLDQVAEEIHIKIEYLEAIENGSFDTPLPDIYKRGFLRLYAEYLHLDVDAIMKQCPIPPFETLNSTPKRREMAIDIVKKTQQKENQHVDPSIQLDSENDEPIDEISPLESHSNSLMEFLQKNPKLKKIAKYCFIVLCCFLGLVLFSKIFSHSKSKIKSPKTPAENLVSNPESSSTIKKFVIRSSGEVRIMVRDKNDKTKIFSGTVLKGSEKMIEFSNPVQLFFDKGESFIIEMPNGEIVHPDAGRGGIEIK